MLLVNFIFKKKEILSDRLNIFTCKVDSVKLFFFTMTLQVQKYNQCGKSSTNSDEAPSPIILLTLPAVPS